MQLKIIKGISEAREKEFNKLGIFDTADLIRFFPKRYLDLRERQMLKNVYNNDIILTCGKIISFPSTRFFKGKSLVKVNCEQEGFFFNIVWFNQPYVSSKLKVGEEYLFYGRVTIDDDGTRLTNPSFELCERVFRLQGIVPQYSLKGTLSQKLTRDSVKVAVSLEKPQSIIPFSLQKKYGLEDLFTSYKEVHNPTNFQSLERASNRIAVEEYFSLISAFKFLKGDKNQVRTNRYDCSSKELVEFISSRFQYEFTDGQKQAVNEIFNDLTSENIMNRLLQGDVGCGKTAVSNCAIFVAVKSGYQVAVISPTEVLARQNHKVISTVFKDYNVGLLVGSLTAKEKKEVKQATKAGIYNILVGTHALLEDDVEFKRLSLCICDEQQRFGVAQRSSLISKGVLPDLLVMSATPIPRTLSLIFYGDLDITTVKDKPKNRIKVQTNIVPNEKYNDMFSFIRREIEEGREAYFVCPKIDGDDDGTIMSVNELYQDVSTRLQGINVGLLHGKLSDKEKNSVMQDFVDGKVKALVSTTVIEVGVDVKNASVIVIYNAERFGLSTLHQLRGRVGRSDIKSYCFLLSNTKSEEGIKRLNILKDNSDGFKISEYDYKLRGSGDFMGSRQSGKFIGDLGNLNYSTESIFLAKKISDDAISLGENIEFIREVAIKKYNKLKDISLN